MSFAGEIVRNQGRNFSRKQATMAKDRALSFVHKLWNMEKV